MNPAETNGVKPARQKNKWLVTAVITAVLLGSVAVAVTHNPVHAPVPQVVVATGDLINAPSAPVAPPAPPAGPAPQIVSMPPIKAVDGYVALGFDRLAAFPIKTKWEMTDPIRIKGEQRIVGEIPDAIKSLDKNKVAVQGFMLPLKVTDGLVSDFFLLRTQARCCYGLPISVNELLTVHMTGTGVKSLMDQPVTIYGTFHLAETRDASTGTLDAIYTLDGEKMATPTL